MTENTIVLDTNFIREVSIGDLGEMSENARLVSITEVKEELHGKQEEKIKKARILFEELDKEVYVILEQIMQLDKISSLVNYLNNEGTADPLILAYAKKLISKNSNLQMSFFGERKIFVATNDQGLKKACRFLGLNVYNLGDNLI